MPIPPPSVKRRHKLRRNLSCDSYLREDGNWDIEGHLTDAPKEAMVLMGGEQIKIDELVHDISIRLVIDDDLTILKVEAAMDITPWATCQAVPAYLESLQGSSLGRGFNKTVAELVGDTRGCTHVRELLGRMAMSASMAISSFKMGNEDRDQFAKKFTESFADSCLSFDRNRELVQRFAPEYYTGPTDPHETKESQAERTRHATRRYVEIEENTIQTRKSAD